MPPCVNLNTLTPDQRHTAALLGTATDLSGSVQSQTAAQKGIRAYINKFKPHLKSFLNEYGFTAVNWLDKFATMKKYPELREILSEIGNMGSAEKQLVTQIYVQPIMDSLTKIQRDTKIHADNVGNAVIARFLQINDVNDRLATNMSDVRYNEIIEQFQSAQAKKIPIPQGILIGAGATNPKAQDNILAAMSRFDQFLNLKTKGTGKDAAAKQANLVQKVDTLYNYLASNITPLVQTLGSGEVSKFRDTLNILRNEYLTPNAPKTSNTDRLYLRSRLVDLIYKKYANDPNLPELAEGWQQWKEFRDHSGAFSNGVVNPDFYSNANNVPIISELLKPLAGNADFDKITSLVDKASARKLDKLLAVGRISGMDYAALKKRGQGYMPIVREHNAIDEIIQLMYTGGSTSSGGGEKLHFRIGATEGLPKTPFDHYFAHMLSDGPIVNQQLVKMYNTLEAAETAFKQNGTPNPYSELFTTATQLPKGWTRNRETTAVERSTASTLKQKTYITLWKDGKRVYILPNKNNTDAGWALFAINNRSGRNLNAVESLFNSFNMMQKATTTTLSPLYLAMNALVDPQAARLNAQAYPEMQPHLDKIFDAKSLRQAWKDVRDYGLWDGQTPLDARLQKVQRAYEDGALGGLSDTYKSGYGHTAVSKKVNRGANPIYGKAYTTFWEHAKNLELMQTTFEKYIRYQTYNVMVNELQKSGFTEARARSVASKYGREITTDFSKTGLYGKVMNAYWLFSQATINGSHQILHNVARSPELQNTLLGVMSASLLIDFIGRTTANEDEYGDNEWVKAQELNGDRYMLLPIPLEDGTYPKLPMPWVYNAFYRAPQLLAKSFYGDKDATLGKTSNRLFSMLANAASPLGDINAGVAQNIGPTMLDPFFQVGSNMNYKGAPLHPIDFAGEKPNAETYFKNTPAVYRQLARFLNRNTFGSERESGVIDWYPSTFEVLHNTLVGTAGQFVESVAGTAKSAIDTALYDEKFNWNDFPFRHRFLLTPRLSYQGAMTFSDRMQQIHAAELLEKDAGEGSAASKEVWEHRPLQKSMVETAKKARKHIRALNKQLTKTDDKAAQDEILVKIGKYQAEFNREWERKEA